MYMAVLGSHPQLSLAELMSCYGPTNVQQLSNKIALVEVPTINLEQLGGTLKVAKVLVQVSSTNFTQVKAKLWEWLANYHYPGSGKLNFGISVYGNINPKFTRQLGVEIKRQFVQTGQPARFIPNQSPTLSTAQVLHNRLHTNGLEIIIGLGSGQAIIGQTVAVQDINAYTARDYERPCRDPKVGMLPPKLAQIMLNLAVGQLNHGSRGMSHETRKKYTVLDPFCGTGVVIQEALLAGFNVNGLDIDERMINCSRQNLDWLAQTQQIGEQWNLEIVDARSAHFPNPINAVVSEIYLGPPLSQVPDTTKLKAIRLNVNNLLHSFLKNMAAQIKSDTPLCLAVPVWQTGKGILKLSLIDQLELLGYNFKRFGGANPADLIYRRPNQIVGRQLLALTKS